VCVFYNIIESKAVWHITHMHMHTVIKTVIKIVWCINWSWNV